VQPGNVFRTVSDHRAYCCISNTHESVFGACFPLVLYSQHMVHSASTPAVCSCCCFNLPWWCTVQQVRHMLSLRLVLCCASSVTLPDVQVP
jgi:hypothetical protein